MTEASPPSRGVKQQQLGLMALVLQLALLQPAGAFHMAPVAVAPGARAALRTTAITRPSMLHAAAPSCGGGVSSISRSSIRRAGQATGRGRVLGGGVGGAGHTPRATQLSMDLQLDNFAKKTGLSRGSLAVLKRYEERTVKINALEAQIEALSDEELRAKTQEFRDRIQDANPQSYEDTQEALDSVLDEAFAVVREAAYRVLGLRHYDVQLVGGMALNEGRLTEMATGEGKTLVATLPAYLNALAGRGGVLVVTVNDYLARRDAEVMGQVHRFLGLTVGLVQSSSTPAERREAYGSDVTYCTNQEVGFDYLRDHLATTEEGLVQIRPFAFCLVDECDSILIDEARTPLIISRSVPAPKNKFLNAFKIAGILRQGLHYVVSEKDMSIVLTEQGYDDCQKILGADLFNPMDPWASYIINACKAKELFKKDKDYVVADGQVQIVDTFSGRMLEGRKFSDGLHQSIEAFNGIEVGNTTQAIAQITYQSLFKQFEKLAGMTGTAMTDARELENTYGLATLPVPTALPAARRDYPDVVFRTKNAARRALLREVTRLNADGRPMLIGTTSVEASEELAKVLVDEGVNNVQILNARPGQVEREAEIVAQAGRRGVVTVATNMAGRGTDILLGGSPSMMAKIFVRDALAQMMLNEEELAEIPEVGDNFYPEVEGSVLADAEKALKEAYETEKETGKEYNRLMLEDVVAVAGESGPLDDQHASFAFAKELRGVVQGLKEAFTEALKEEKEDVLDMGGLYVIGTSRHESRRVDNQLRGRAGRQGDPGGTRFFLSLDDDLFKTFGGDQIAKVLETFRVGEDVPIENKKVTSTLDKVQVQTEQYFESIRNAVFEYDGFLSDQRTETYFNRNRLLRMEDQELQDVFENFVRRAAHDIIKGVAKSGSMDAKLLKERQGQMFGASMPQGALEESQLSALANNEDELRKYCEEAAIASWKAKYDQLEAVRAGLAMDVVRYLVLTQYDNHWATHLERIKALKESTGMESYRGRDPLMEFFTQGAEVFSAMKDSIRRDAVYSTVMYQPTKAAAAAAAGVQ